MSQDRSKQEQLQDALGMLDDDLLLEVEELRRVPQKKTKFHWQRLAAIAACLCVLLGLMFAGNLWGNRNGSDEFLVTDGATAVTEGASEECAAEQEEEEASQECAVTEEAAEEDTEEYDEVLDNERKGKEVGMVQTAASGVVIEPMKVDLCDHPNVEVDMEALFIYGGRCYVYYGTLTDASRLIGDHLGTAEGLIDEWTEKDGYVELAGSVEGDFYSVNGFDPDFVLCMPCEGDSVEIYINNNDLTLYTGEDLLKERFKVDGNFRALCMSHQRWFNSTGGPYTMDEEGNEQVWALVEAMYEAPFVYTKDLELPAEAKSIYDTALYHLYLQLDNGMEIHLRLFEGGYVQLDGFHSICLQVEEEVFKQALEAMDRTENSLCGVPLEEES